MTTHFAAVKDGLVVGTRSSASRHAGGTGKFGPYTHAVLRTERTVMLATEQATVTADVISWHGSHVLALNGLRDAKVGTSHTVDYAYRPRETHYTRTYLEAELVEVFITKRKPKLGDRLFDAPPSPSTPELATDASL